MRPGDFEADFFTVSAPRFVDWTSALTFSGRNEFAEWVHFGRNIMG
jgi:hypothetical protein